MSSYKKIVEQSKRLGTITLYEPKYLKKLCETVFKKRNNTPPPITKEK
jgi:hypothetical protein